MPRHNIQLLFLLVLCTFASGCVAVSMHSTRDVRLTVTEPASGAPAAHIPVSADYDYDSYGWFYFANTPHSESATTDELGQVTLPLADYRYGVVLNVGKAVVILDKEAVRHGGVVSAYRGPLRYTVQLNPL